MIRKISIRDLKPGMFVAGLPGSPLLDAQRVYAVEGYVRSDDEILDIVRAGYREVFVDLRSALADRVHGDSGAQAGARTAPLDQELERLPEKPRSGPESGPSDPDGGNLGAEVIQARAIYEQTLQVARLLFTQAAQGRALALDAAREAVAATLDGVRISPTAALWAARLHASGARLHIHSVNVSLLAVAFGLHLGLEREDVTQLGMAGLLHDIGQVYLPMELTTRRGDLTPPELSRFMRHPGEGEALLRRQGGLPEAVCRAVREHHEQHDGKGYPDRLSGAARGLFGRILALGNRFDALARPGGEPLSASPARAMTLLYAGRGTVHAADDLDRFIRFAGVYPLGSLVRLSDGSAGMVWRHDPENPLAPLVNVALDPQLRPVPPRRVNLAALAATADQELHVSGDLDPRLLGFSQYLLVPGQA